MIVLDHVSLTRTCILPSCIFGKEMENKYQRDLHYLTDFKLSLRDQDVTLFIFFLPGNNLVSGSG